MKAKKFSNNLIAPVICMLLVAAMIAVAIAVYGASPAGLFIYAFFFIVYVMIPGWFILKQIPLKISHLSTKITLALFTGWSAELLVYFINDAVPTDVLLYAAGPIMSIFCIISLARSSDRERISFDRLLRILRNIPVSAWVFFALVLLIAMLTTQYVYLAPALSDFTYVNPDKAYHMGLIDSLSHDYPLMSLWIDGREINYHIFTEMLYSVPVRLFGLDSDFIMMSCGPLMTSFTLCVSMYSFFREMSSRPERAGTYSLMVILASLYLVRTYYKSIAFQFIVTNDNAAGYGVASAFAFVIVLKMYEEQFGKPDRKSIPVICLLTAYIMLVTGIKGPMGAVLIVSMWGTLLLGWILRKVPFSQIVPLAAMSAGFILVYTQILGSKGQTTGGGNSIFEIANITNICFWKQPLIDMMKAAGIPEVVRLGIVLLVFLIFYLTAFFLPVCIGYIRELVLVLSGKKEYKVWRVLVYAVFAAGFIAMFVLRYSGHSQIYFGLISLYFAPVIAYWFFEDMEDADLSEKRFARGAVNAVKVVFAATLCCTTVFIGIYIYNLVPECISHTDPDMTYDTYLSMSNAEYEAMEWIQDSTPEDSLLATDRYYSVPLDEYSYQNRWDNRFFLYASYANRFCYIAGSGYNMKAEEWPLRKEMIEKSSTLYDAANDDRGNDARALGVDYVVVSKRFTDIPSLENKDYSLCFSNEDVDIYEVLSEPAA